MVKNYFYLIVGLLCILFAVTHTLNGTATVLPVLDNVGMGNSVKTTFTYVWHIIGIENLILGIALLVMAFHKNLSKVKFTAWLIIAILTVRWITIATFTILNDSNAMKQLIPDTAAIFVIIVLLLFGTKVKSKISNE
jgi:membrane-associated HD superfamily phosphohydrolase